MSTQGTPQPALNIPKRWPLVSKLNVRQSALPMTQDARLVNCYAEFDPELDEFWIYKRLGLSSTSAFGPGGGTSASPVRGQGAYYSPATSYGIFNVFGGWLYNGATSIDTVDATNPYTWETVVTSSGTIVVLNNGAAQYTSNGTSQLNITSSIPGTPPYCPGWAYLDGTLYIMDTSGNIWGSGINQPTSWSNNNLILANNYADSGVALARQLSYVIAFKQWSTQIFYDAGNTEGSPLGVVPDAQLPFGCLNGWSVQELDGTLLWLTSNRSNSPQIAAMTNLSARIVSTPAVERLLKLYQLQGGTGVDLQGVYSWVIRQSGHRLYGLTIVGLNVTIVYDLDQQLWYLWTDANGNYWPYVASTYYPAVVLKVGSNYTPTPASQFFQHVWSGSAYQVDDCFTYPNDSGSVVPVDIYTPNFDGGTSRRKLLKALFPLADRTQGSYLQMRFNDYDYDPTRWSNFRTCDLGLQKPRFIDCGTFRTRRALHLRHQCNTSFRIRGIDMQLLWGTL